MHSSIETQEEEDSSNKKSPQEIQVKESPVEIRHIIISMLGELKHNLEEHIQFR